MENPDAEGDRCSFIEFSLVNWKLFRKFAEKLKRMMLDEVPK